MRSIRLVPGPVLIVALLSTTPAAALDTKAAGRCVALGALSEDYAAKATAILATASATGHRALVDQRAREELAQLARLKHDKTGKDAWTFAAISACRSF